MSRHKIQRIRDPVHNLIEFDCSDALENTLWQIIQTPSFQRLRRIKQLGFSEFVFPGATHTRFAHSIGVFHTARQLIKVIKKFAKNNSLRFENGQADPAIAAALLHDVGHGMFSHAFETVGKEFGWPMARHEQVSRRLIREGEIADILNTYYPHFAENVSDVIARDVPDNLFDSVVSSQFDADRLDYMQRDRLMAGVQSSSVDPVWLLANLEIAEINTSSDNEFTGKVQTLVLGPKAVQTAEGYVFSLFHLYPNVYLHKTTRGIEALFKALMKRIVHLITNGDAEKTGLPGQHPIIKFIEEPKDLELALALDDTVFWGALPFFYRRQMKKQES